MIKEQVHKLLLKAGAAFAKADYKQCLDHLLGLVVLVEKLVK